MADLARAIEALAAAVEAAAEFVPEGDLAAVGDLVDATRSRHGYLGETVVVALAGGTGSGKSSLLNALAGESVSPVGPVRPTTSRPLAWIPANPEPGLTRLLDDLGLDDRTGHDSALPVAIIDLPDYDSVEFEHRATVEALLPRVDAVIWVLDPQKYSDRALHRDYLVPLVAYQDQFLFVLNQVDRLDEPGLGAVLADLARRLKSEGFRAPRIVTAAVRPPEGPPHGLDTLVAVMAERFRAKQTAHAKLVQDLRRGHHLLTELTGLSDEPDPDFATTWTGARRSAASGLADLVAGPAMAADAERVGERLATSRAAGPVGRLGALLRRSRLGRALGAAPEEPAVGEWWAQPGLERVLAGLSRTIIGVSTTVGGGLGRRIRSEFPPERLAATIRASVEGARDRVGLLDLPAVRRWWSVSGAIQLIAFAALVGGIVWVWVDGVDRGQVPWNLLMIAGSVAVAAGLSWGARASGRRAGRTRARAYRAEIEQVIDAQIEGRIGTSLKEVVAARDRVGGALAVLQDALEG